MKKYPLTTFVTIACVTAILMLTICPNAAPYHHIYFAQGPDPGVEVDLEKLKAPRDARDLGSLENAIDSDSQKWKGTNHVSYLAYMYGACGEISSYDYSDRSRQARLLTRYSLEVLDSGNLSLDQSVRFLRFLTYDASDWDEVTWRHLRLQKANLWLDTWAQFATSLDPSFDPTEVPMINIAPPTDSGVPSGSSPESVKDPKLRAEYERSLADNQARTARIAEQQYLRMNADQFYKEAENYLVNAYSRPPSDSAELQRLLAEKQIDTAASARLLAKIKEHK
jgi:hypothetical protein